VRQLTTLQRKSIFVNSFPVGDRRRRPIHRHLVQVGLSPSCSSLSPLGSRTLRSSREVLPRLAPLIGHTRDVPISRCCAPGRRVSTARSPSWPTRCRCDCSAAACLWCCAARQDTPPAKSGSLPKGARLSARFKVERRVMLHHHFPTWYR